MKNLSLVSKLTTHLWILASIVIISTCSVWLLTEKFPLIVGLCIILPLIYIYYINKIIRTETAILPSMHTIFSEIGNGVFESRLTNINDATELGALAWQCNNMLDQFEAFYRERTTASAYYREGKYYRKAFSLGLRGNFARLVEDLNVSLENGRKATQEIIRNKEYLQSEIRRITSSLNSLVENDLTVRIEERSNDEIGILISYLNSVLSSLDSVIADFQHSALTVTHAVEHMHEHSRDIFSLLQSQEDKITEIAHSTEDMSKVIIENAQSISHAALLTTSTTERTQSGKNSVQRTVDGMQQIASMVRTTATMIEDLGKATSEIEIVAQTIEEIADQTNLLALNAAIEAARAGEAGRGFAVVADEVRKLAERTQVSTKEITKTIRDIQTRTNDVVAAAQNGIEQVEQGISLAVQADGMLDGIVREANNVKNILTQISVATEELSASSQHIAAATNDLRQNIGSHALQIDSVRTSIETLREQSDHLDLASSGFKTSDNSSSLVSSQQIKRLYAAQ